MLEALIGIVALSAMLLLGVPLAHLGRTRGGNVQSEGD